MKQLLSALLMLPVVASLGGCLSFGAKPPPTLLTLAPAQQIAVGQVQSSARARALVVQVPVTSASLATVRVPVQATATTLAYLKGAAWAEPPARLFARLVADTLTADGAVVLSGVQSVDSPAGNLAGELRNFGVDATPSTPRSPAVASRRSRSAASRRAYRWRRSTRPRSVRR